MVMLLYVTKTVTLAKVEIYISNKGRLVFALIFFLVKCHSVNLLKCGCGAYACQKGWKEVNHSVIMDYKGLHNFSGKTLLFCLS